MDKTSSPSAPASFLNLDLELRSASDLTAIAEHLESQAFVLYTGKANGDFLLRLEPLIESSLSNNILACTEHFLGLLNSLPPELMSMWQSCTSRIFDYGFDGGFESAPLDVAIPAATLAQMIQLGTDIRITVYPFSENNNNSERKSA